MEWHVWLGFMVASAVMGLMPGPGVVSILGYALGSGRRVALASVAGMALGNAIAMTLSLAGVGAVLAASDLAFAIVKWAGAAYLIGLGLIAIFRNCTPPKGLGVPAAPIGARAAFAGNVVVGTFHPKTLIFFVAFVPQFITAGDGYGGQAALLVVTFCLTVAVTDSVYALAASAASRLVQRPRTAAWSRRAGGGILIAAGLATAAARR